MHPVHCLALISALGHFCSACFAQSASPDECGPDVVYRFDKVEYEWPNRTIENRFKNAKSNPIGIKVHADRVFLNVPRWHGNDHPVNLAVVPRPRDEACIKSPSAPRLKPFPNLEFQRLGDCNAIQYVQSMQIEPSGVMWLPGNSSVRNTDMQDKANVRLHQLPPTAGGAKGCGIHATYHSSFLAWL